MNCRIYTLSNKWANTDLPHEDEFRDLLLAIQNGSSFGDAFRGAYGVRVTEIWDQFLQETKQNTTPQQGFSFFKTVAPPSCRVGSS